MRCYLFWWSSEKEKTLGRQIVPVSYLSPDDLIEPFYVEATPEHVAWLKRYKDPIWVIGKSGLENALRMNMLAGCWPDPIDVDAYKVPKTFNDRMPF